MALLRQSRRRRRQVTSSSVIYVEPSPQVVEGNLQVVFFVVSANSSVISGDQVVNAITTNKDSLQQAVSECSFCIKVPFDCFT